ncbi:1455_t:CDS:1 [Scutellospora calospora]|uniref:1455_t:CDS:1 n=1 Tax=Scutellospora calospora TaxID=85575 RepID=A0ACA9JW40_9GLOM|nr:1455_t:CDS:1 [Scutellospora calospora]
MPKVKTPRSRSSSPSEVIREAGRMPIVRQEIDLSKEPHEVVQLVNELIREYGDVRTTKRIDHLWNSSVNTRAKTIPRPQNCFILFRNDITAEYNPQKGDNNADISDKKKTGKNVPKSSKIAKERWAAIKRDNQREYQFWIKLTEIAKLKHTLLYPNYKYSPVRNKESRSNADRKRKRSNNIDEQNVQNQEHKSPSAPSSMPPVMVSPESLATSRIIILPETIHLGLDDINTTTTKQLLNDKSAEIKSDKNTALLQTQEAKNLVQTLPDHSRSCQNNLTSSDSTQLLPIRPPSNQQLIYTYPTSTQIPGMAAQYTPIYKERRSSSPYYLSPTIMEQQIIPQQNIATQIAQQYLTSRVMMPASQHQYIQTAPQQFINPTMLLAASPGQQYLQYYQPQTPQHVNSTSIMPLPTSQHSQQQTPQYISPGTIISPSQPHGQQSSTASRFNPRIEYYQDDLFMLGINGLIDPALIHENDPYISSFSSFSSFSSEDP